MIKSFKHKGLEILFYKGSTKGIQPKHKTRFEDIYDLLDAIIQIQYMNLPGSKLHKLETKKDNIWSVTVSGNWGVIFKFIDGDAYEVNYTDYH